MIDSTTPSYPQVGNLDLFSLFDGGSKAQMLPVAVARIMSLLSYFAQSVAVDDREIILERIHTSAFKPNWDQTFSSKIVNVESRPMENFTAKGFVNFANKRLHGNINPSATQEKVLFSVCPELYVAMLFSPPMKSDEIIVIRNVRRFAEYEGYGPDFRFVRVHEPEIIDVLSIDAVTENHFFKRT